MRIVMQDVPGLYCAVQITWYLSSLTLQTSMVNTVLSLLGSGRHGQATLYPFQKHLRSWEKYIVYFNGIVSVKVKFCAVLESIFVKNWIASKKLQSPACYETMFLKRRENVWNCVRCVSPLTSLPLHPALSGIKLSDEDSTSVRQSWGVSYFSSVTRYDSVWVI
jgi:hypothetical protein